MAKKKLNKKTALKIEEAVKKEFEKENFKELKKIDAAAEKQMDINKDPLFMDIHDDLTKKPIFLDF